MENELHAIKSLVASGLIAFWTSDANGKLVGVSASWEALTGQSGQVQWQAMVFPDGIKAAESSWRRAVKTSKMFQHSTRIFNKRTGQFDAAILTATASKDGWSCVCVLLEPIDEVPEASTALSAIDLAFAGGGIMGKMIREKDWSQTSLGPIETWPQSLVTTASLIIQTHFPMHLYWGPQRLLFYNDAYISILNEKHPCLGQPGHVVWAEVWDYLEEQFENVRNEKPDWFENEQVFIRRNHRLEETFFTYGFSAIFQEDGHIAGYFSPVMETTQRVLAERRLMVLLELAQTASNALQCHEVLFKTGRLFEKYSAEIPFALIYLRDTPSKFILMDSGLLERNHPAAVNCLSSEDDNTSPWSASVAAALKSFKHVIVDNLSEKFGRLPGGSWSDPAECALVCPVALSAQETPDVLLILGVNSRRPLDDGYLSFFDLVVRQVASTYNSARRQEDEQKHTKALAEVNAAKNTFFSNVSHEFRTPLTLILGPLEDCLADPTFSSVQHSKLNIILRNAQRLLKLVNSLLDFSRIEAGRAQAKFVLTDLVQLTAQLASMFRSLVEAGGLQFDVDLQPLHDAVFVDNDFWEKIVCNLLSNAFKFTLQGHVRITLGSTDDLSGVQLKVSDTGCGIPESEISRIFQRFYRVPGSHGRSFEGSGIGLALCAELVQIHGGTLTVTSNLGEGSTFTVTIPYGSSHLPQEHVVPTSATHRVSLKNGASFIDEAIQWLPDSINNRDKSCVDTDSMMVEQTSDEKRSTILLIDDNYDMRQYIYDLLKSASYNVLAATDGQAGLDIIRSSEILPDLVVSDVMMPRVNGLELVSHLRNNARTESIPIILLSARAGIEASVEGLQAGADDYLVKPFSAKELLARVRTQLHIRWLEQQRILEIEESRRNQEKFVDVICHEMRNPLNAILNNADLLRTSLNRKHQQLHGLSPELRVLFLSELQNDHDALLAIESCVQHQRMVADDVLNASRFKEGKLNLEMRDFHIDDVILMAVRMFTAEIKAKNIDMLVSISPTITPELTLRNDPQRIMQIAVNLISNAIKFTQPCVLKKVTVSADVTLDADQHNALVSVSVSDTGIGMTLEQQERLFQRFSQVQTHNYLGGSGLGLHICLTLATLMNGSIQVISEQHHGSQFVFTFPCTYSTSLQAQGQLTNSFPVGAPATNESFLKRLKILIVDDNLINQDVLRRQLEVSGVAELIVVACNGLEAVQMYQAQPFDVVLMDAEMPIMDGLEATRQIRMIEQQSQRNPILIVGLSGNARQEHIDAAMSAGMSDYIVKPFQKQQLLEKITKASK